MKKYILLTLIFMVFSICGGEDSSQMTTDENQTTQNLQNEDINTSENVVSKEPVSYTHLTLPTSDLV